MSYKRNPREREREVPNENIPVLVMMYDMENLKNIPERERGSFVVWYESAKWKLERRYLL